MNAVLTAGSVRLPANRPGRYCPMSYSLSPDSFLQQPEQQVDLVYVVGGLYGNTEALQTLLHAFEAEPTERKLLYFNGDFHWFDRSPALFDEVEQGTRPHLRLRGNVETELASDDDSAGCGCAYPDSVDQDDVDRSNAMLAMLRQTARALGVQGDLARLAPVARVRCGRLGIAITHGDDQSLAGWSFAHDRIDQAWREGLASRMASLDVQLFASSHTCLAVASTIEWQGRVFGVINNGAAGMANFAGDPNGLLTRIASDHVGPAPVSPVYRASIAGCTIEALPVAFDHLAWLRRFRAMWPAGSEADQSYRSRIEHGPAYPRESAARGLFRV